MKTLIIGHSFIDRYRRYLRRFEQYVDVGALADFSAHFGLAPGNTVHIQGRSGLRIDSYGKEYILDRVRRVQPEILIVEIGTNDIVYRYDPADIATQLKLFYRELLSNTSVNYIVQIQIIERRRAGYRRDDNLDRDQFDENKKILNAILQRFTRVNENVRVFRHDRNLIVKLQQDSISRDDIHVTTQKGLEYYHFSIRRAVVTAQATLLKRQAESREAELRDRRIVQLTGRYDPDFVRRKDRVYSFMNAGRY